MANPKATTALLLALILIGSMVVMTIPAASAQTGIGPYGRLDQTMRINYSDGSFSAVRDSEFFKPTGSITGLGGKKMTSLEMELRVVLPSSTDSIQQSAASQIVKVLRPDGTWANVNFVPTVHDYNFEKSGPNLYRIYLATIPVSSIISAVGAAPANFPSEIRVTSGSNVAFYGSVGDRTGGFYTTQTLTTFKITVNAQDIEPGPVDNSGGGGDITPNPQEPVPTGKVYSTVLIDYTDGTRRGLGATSPEIPFDVFYQTANKKIDKITYSLILYLDRDVFSVKPLSYQNNAAPDNYSVTVNNKGIAKQSNPFPAKATAPGQWKLLEMVVTKETLENAIDLTDSVQGPSGTASAGKGKLSFYIRESTLTLASPTKEYSVALPEFKTTLDLDRTTFTPSNPSEDPSCEIADGECKNGASDSMNLQTVLVVASISLLMGGGAWAFAKKRRK